MKMKGRHLIVLLLFLAGCNQLEEKKVTVAFDEAALKEFVLASAGKDKTIVLREMDSLLTIAVKDSAVFFQTVSYLEKPFGNPNSAYRNEEYYAQVLTAKMKSEWIDSTTKSMTREKLYLLMQNRPGSLANDFTYATASGAKKKLYDIKVDHVLLYFYNPECNACKEMKTALQSSSIISEKVKSGELKILAIYTDKDEMVWLNQLCEMPEEWIHGRDENEYLYKNKLYDLRAIPTVYLLDKDKKVVLKDCVNIGMIEEVLQK